MSSEIEEIARAGDAALARLARLIEPGSLLEATPECLVVAHADGRIVFANHHARGADRLLPRGAGRQARRAAARGRVRDRAGRRRAWRPSAPITKAATIPVEVHVGSIEGAERFLVVTLRDMTELQAGREARFEAEAKYRTLVEQIPAVVYLDPVDENQDSIYVSPQVTDLLGDRARRIGSRTRTAGATTSTRTTSTVSGRSTRTPTGRTSR